ncbi:hypothetical protein [Gemmata obscuriglobus]|uniref:hypothetical protein n=1 Tax=Gemmata obscuriglobus TaxID=114 RepID=UPI00031914AB|nr:hypothetical protein [Gemmata obscuriglobus]
MPHNRPADRQEQIEQTFEAFKFAGTSVEGISVGRGRTKFIRVSYKTAWAPVREVDRKLTHLFDEQ